MKSQFNQAPKLPRLRVSENVRFLVKEDGSPFFWMGDTAWFLPKINPSEVELYLSNRAQHGFTVIQACSGYDANIGFDRTNYAGRRPFLNDNTDTPDESFWLHVDFIARKTHEYGLYLALVPMWGDEYSRAFKGDAQKAHRLGQWLGKRYNIYKHVLWITSGEYDLIHGPACAPITSEQKDVLMALAWGLREVHKGAQLMTIHPCSLFTSSSDFHQETWLDFNMLQSGHEDDREEFGNPENHTLIERDYGLIPIKPVLDGEPFYEDTPDGVWVYGDARCPRGGAEVVRRKAYWSVFAGAFGHTYGHNDICLFFQPTYPGEMVLPPNGSGQHNHWKDALDASGATQLKHLRALMESLPFLNRVPDQSVIASPIGTGRNHLRATRAADGSYALVYLPAGGTVEINMDYLAAEVKSAWYNPRTGDDIAIGAYPNQGKRAFTAPGNSSVGNDWVLVLKSTTLKDAKV